MDKNPPANAEDMGLIPDLGRFHMPWNIQACVPQLQSSHSVEVSNCDYWARMPRACALQQEKSVQWETHTPQLESSAPSLQLEKAQQQRPSTIKKKNLIKQQKNVSLKLNLPFYVLLFKTRLLDYLKLPMVEKHMDAHGEQGVGEELGDWD